MNNTQDGKGVDRPPGTGHSLGGISIEGLAGLTVEQLKGNMVALTMLLHFFRQHLDENLSLKNDLNTLRTYVAAYEKRKESSRVAALLFFVSNIGVGFGVNLLTNDTTWPGIATLVPALVLAAVGGFLSLRSDRANSG